MSFRKAADNDDLNKSFFTYSNVDSTSRRDSWRQRSSFSFSSNYEQANYSNDNHLKSYFTYSEMNNTSPIASNGSIIEKVLTTIKKKPMLSVTRGTKSMEDSRDVDYNNRFGVPYRPKQDIVFLKSLSQIDLNDMSKITPNLFLSGMKPVTLDRLRHLGITMIVSVLREGCPVRASGIECVEVPVDDHEATNIGTHFHTLLPRIHDHITEDGRVLVHCIAGISRSATIVLAYLLQYHGLNLREAYKLVKSRRSCIQPNPGFWKQLVDYETELAVNVKNVRKFSQSDNS